MLLSCEYVWTVIPTELQSAEQGRNLAFCAFKDSASKPELICPFETISMRLQECSQRRQSVAPPEKTRILSQALMQKGCAALSISQPRCARTTGVDLLRVALLPPQPLARTALPVSSTAQKQL